MTMQAETKGLIVCANCQRKTGGLCPSCGSSHCMIKIYHDGKDYHFRKNQNGDFYTFDEAASKLPGFLFDIREGTLDPAATRCKIWARHTRSTRCKGKELKSIETAQATDMLTYPGYVRELNPEVGQRVDRAVQELIAALQVLVVTRQIAVKGEIRELYRMIYNHTAKAAASLTIYQSGTLERACEEIEKGLSFTRFMRREIHISVPKEPGGGTCVEGLEKTVLPGFKAAHDGIGDIA